MNSHRHRKLNAQTAWAAFERYIRSIMPHAEANKILLHAKEKHDSRWREHEKLRHEIRNRRITEDDYEG
jgi:hypothetical protein